MRRRIVCFGDSNTWGYNPATEERYDEDVRWTGILAELLGAQLGCTRPLVEAGWLDYPHQIGQTGVSVAPELLVSVGVSGAVQHLAGIGGAKTVIAINEDAGAPIFGAAHYRVVGDAIAVVRALVERLEADAAAC